MTDGKTLFSMEETISQPMNMTYVPNQTWQTHNAHVQNNTTIGYYQATWTPTYRNAYMTHSMIPIEATNYNGHFTYVNNSKEDYSP